MSIRCSTSILGSPGSGATEPCTHTCSPVARSSRHSFGRHRLVLLRDRAQQGAHGVAVVRGARAAGSGARPGPAGRRRPARRAPGSRRARPRSGSMSSMAMGASWNAAAKRCSAAHIACSLSWRAVTSRTTTMTAGRPSYSIPAAAVSIGIAALVVDADQLALDVGQPGIEVEPPVALGHRRAHRRRAPTPAPACVFSSSKSRAPTRLQRLLVGEDEAAVLDDGDRVG